MGARATGRQWKPSVSNMSSPWRAWVSGARPAGGVFQRGGWRAWVSLSGAVYPAPGGQGPPADAHPSRKREQQVHGHGQRARAGVQEGGAAPRPQDVGQHRRHRGRGPLAAQPETRGRQRRGHSGAATTRPPPSLPLRLPQLTSSFLHRLSLFSLPLTAVLCINFSAQH